MSAQLKPVLVPKTEIDIEFDVLPRIAPRIYPAYVRKASVYRDKRFNRWVCLVLCDVLSDSLEKIDTVAWFLNLGCAEKPRAGTTSKYYAAWVKANGGKRPVRQDRMTPRIFENRYVTVVIEDTKTNHRHEAVFDDGAYSIVRDVVSWDTGDCTDSGTEKENDTRIKQSTRSTNQLAIVETSYHNNHLQTVYGKREGHICDKSKAPAG